MKKHNIIFFAFLFLGLFSASGQEQNKVKKKPNFEISFDAFQFTHSQFANISFSFDYLLNESESIGLTPSYRLNDYSIGANYKHFFSKKYTQGFYTEVGLSYRVENCTINYPNELNYLLSKTYKTLNFDFKLGYKLVSKKNFFLDVYTGLTQSIIGTNPETYQYRDKKRIEFGIKIGNRF